MKQTEQPKDLMRPSTKPFSKSRYRFGDRNRKQIDQVAVGILRPSEIFFKQFFQRDKYIWVIFNKELRTSKTMEAVALYNKCVQSYTSMNLPDHDLPICTDYKTFKQKWVENFPCKVAIDQNAQQELFQILQQENTIEAKIVTDSNFQLQKKIRSSKYSSKVKGYVDNYIQILKEIKEDMERVKIEGNSDKLQKVRLPNFMKLKTKDKAELIRYRNNIYCLINLHNNKVDMQTSKKRFIQQAQKMYNSQKQKDVINYYKTYPTNDQEILRLYTQDCFFYKCLNNTLRIAKSTQEFFIIGDPLNKMFHAIKNIYNKQYPHTQSRKDMKLYRGVDLSLSETQYLQSCIGSFIEIHGFVSSSFDLEVAKKFARQRKHNNIIEIVFDDINVHDQKIIQNDYGYVSLESISRFNQKEILFNVLNIFKVIGKEKRGDFNFYTLKYGTIFNILDVQNPQFLKDKRDRMAYYTYKELMGQRSNLQDLGQIFLKSNETQKSVDYYQAKIIQASKGGNKQQEVNLTIKKCQALIQNGEPSKALESISILINERSSVKRTATGAKFLQSILNNKQQIIKQIDLTKQFSQAGSNLDQFDDAETKLSEANEALEDALKTQQKWDFDVAFSQLQIQIQMATLKESVQNYNEASWALKQAQKSADAIIQKSKDIQLSFHDTKKLYFQKTLIYQMMARISCNLEGEDMINMDDLQKKYQKTEEILIKLIEEKSYDKSLINIRKAQILRNRQNFDRNKEYVVNLVIDSLFDIKKTTLRDSEVPKTYHLLGQIQKSTHTLASTQNAIGFFQKQYFTNTQYYSQNDPKSIKTVIDIAQCQRQLKDSARALQLMKTQSSIIPFKNKQKHTVISKVLYMMGLSYLDLGQFNFALAAFQKGINMLRQILSSNQFEKYPHRYKIQLQLGRTLTFLNKYNQAQSYLCSYYTFLIKLYHEQHTDVANALNHYGILYMKWKRYPESRNKFQQSQVMYKRTSGQKSLVCAKINCNLGMIYSFFNQKDKALGCIDKARSLFDTIYHQESKDQTDPVHRQSYMIQYYYAEIHKKFHDYKESIVAYTRSIQKLNAFNLKQRKIREQATVSKYLGSISIVQQSSIQRKDQHELICKVKIVQCQVKSKDYSFANRLGPLIKQLQKQISEFRNDKLNDLGVATQLSNFLNYCKKLEKNLIEKGLDSKISDINISDVKLDPEGVNNQSYKLRHQ